jgi:malate dehydrogenase (oxaloacetate-decarboxylating)(NADP+)
MRRFGMQPKVALLSHSSFGSSTHPSARRCASALALLSDARRTSKCDGEMHGDAALDEEVRKAAFPNSRLKGEANLLVMPNSTPPTSRSTC